MRKIVLFKMVCFCLSLLLTVGSVRNIMPQVEPQSESHEININDLLRAKFDEWTAWLTRRLALNGTTSDIFDYSRVISGHTTNVTLSFPCYLLALTHMYEGTNEQFYLSKLRAFIDGSIDNNMNYVTVSGVGQIFFPISFYFDGEDKDTGAIYPAIFGYIATKLYLWTGELKYRNMADRIADESLNKLAVVNNSTDLAWSWAYYRYRDETNAKVGVNRQTFFAWFYALYSKRINSTFTAYVERITNWVWRSQLSDFSLSYDIGENITTPYYTGFSVWATLNAYLIDSSAFSITIKDKIKNTVYWLNNQDEGAYFYQHLYYLVSALLAALKTDFFASSVSSIRTKSMLYIALKSMHFTNKGFVSRLEHYSFGFRWHQQSAGLFTAYPLTDCLLDMNQFNPVTTYNYAVGKHKIVGWKGGIFAGDIRDGMNNYGSQIFHSSRTLTFNPTVLQPLPSLVSITNNTYYIRVRSAYAYCTVDYYVYPTGVFVGDVTGTTTASIVLDDSAYWALRVANGSEWQVTGLTSGNVYTFGTKFLLYLNTPRLEDRRSFFVKGPTPNWKYVSSAPRFNFSEPQTNYSITFSECLSFGHLIQNAETMFSVLEFLADVHDTTQPVSFETSFNAYHNKITELEADASWNTLYQTAHSTPVKLIGHNHPEKVSITSWDYTPNKLSFTVDASSGTTSTTKVYISDKGEPTRVYAKNGTLTWSYDASTKTLELSVMHFSPAEIVVVWRKLGDVDGDGDVDLDDLDYVLVGYGMAIEDAMATYGVPPSTDIDNDGTIDLDDLYYVLRDYGEY